MSQGDRTFVGDVCETFLERRCHIPRRELAPQIPSSCRTPVVFVSASFGYAKRCCSASAQEASLGVDAGHHASVVQ